MAARILKAREEGDRFVVAVHVDTTKTIGDAPDPAWVYACNFGRTEDRDRAVEETILRARAFLATRELDGEPRPHRTEGAQFNLRRFLSREESGRKGGAVMAKEGTLQVTPPWDKSSRKDSREQTSDFTLSGFPTIDDLRGQGTAPRHAPKAPPERKDVPPAAPEERPDEEAPPADEEADNPPDEDDPDADV